MKLRLSKHHLLFAVGILVLFAGVSNAQQETPKQRLRSPASVRGTIGGESQAHYVIRVRKGKTLTVRFSYRKEDDNTASFSVGSASDADGEPLLGRESNNGNTWSGRIPKTGDYIISVVAHPWAHYRLRVSVK